MAKKTKNTKQEKSCPLPKNLYLSAKFKDKLERCITSDRRSIEQLQISAARGRNDGRNDLQLSQIKEMALQLPSPALRAYSDPSIFRSDRVRKTAAKLET